MQKNFEKHHATLPAKNCEGSKISNSVDFLKPAIVLTNAGILLQPVVIYYFGIF